MRFGKLLAWLRVITITGVSQIIIQTLGFASGIIIIRLLSTEEYAVYTLANTMLATMLLLADGGISTGVMAEGGKVWQNQENLGTVLSTGFELRKQFALGVFLLALPVLFFLLRHHGVTNIMAGVIIIALIPAFFSGLSSTQLEIAPKLHQDILPLQKNQLFINIGRFILLVLTLFIFPFAAIGIASSGIAQIYGNRRLKVLSEKYTGRNGVTNWEVRKNIIEVVKKVLPGAVYYCLSGQISIWIISFFGSTTSLAQLGALGRLSMILSMFNALFTILILPRFVRLPDNKRILLLKYFQIQFMWLVVSALILLAVYLFPDKLLFILGGNYSGLGSELLLSVSGSCLSLIAGSSYLLFSNREA